MRKMSGHGDTGTGWRTYRLLDTMTVYQMAQLVRDCVGRQCDVDIVPHILWDMGMYIVGDVPDDIREKWGVYLREAEE